MGGKELNVAQISGRNSKKKHENITEDNRLSC